MRGREGGRGEEEEADFIKGRKKKNQVSAGHTH